MKLIHKILYIHFIFVKFQCVVCLYGPNLVGQVQGGSFEAWTCPGKIQVFLLYSDISGTQKECTELYSQALNIRTRKGMILTLTFSSPFLQSLEHFLPRLTAVGFRHDVHWCPDSWFMHNSSCNSSKGGVLARTLWAWSYFPWTTYYSLLLNFRFLLNFSPCLPVLSPWKPLCQ